MVDSVSNILSQVRIADASDGKTAFIGKDGQAKTGNYSGREVTQIGGPRGAAQQVGRAFVKALISEGTKGLGGDAKAALRDEIKSEADSIKAKAPSGGSRFQRPDFKLFSQLANAVQTLVREFKAQLFTDTVKQAVSDANNLVSVREELTAQKEGTGIQQADGKFIDRIDQAVERLTARVEDLNDEIDIKQQSVNDLRQSGQTELANELEKGIDTSRQKLAAVEVEIKQLGQARADAIESLEKRETFEVDDNSTGHRGWVQDARELTKAQGGVKDVSGADAKFIGTPGLGPTIGDIPDLLDAFWTDLGADKVEFIKVISAHSPRGEERVLAKLDELASAGTISEADRNEIGEALKLSDTDLRSKYLGAG